MQPPSARQLSGLDPDFLMKILGFLDVESLLQFQVAFPQLLSVSRSPDLWLEQLLRVWRLPLQASTLHLRQACPCTPDLCLTLFCSAADAINCIRKRCEHFRAYHSVLF